MSEQGHEAVADASGLRALLDEQAERYPLMQAEDLYKLLHQRANGPGHAGLVEAVAWQALVEEAAGLALESREGEDVTEGLDAGIGLVRVNLRPYLRAGGSLERLFAAFVESCGLLEPEADELPRLLQEAASWLPNAVLELEAEAFRRYLVPLARSGYPAVHHSAIYRTSYAPAYRVLLASALG